MSRSDCMHCSKQNKYRDAARIAVDAVQVQDLDTTFWCCGQDGKRYLLIGSWLCCYLRAPAVGAAGR